MIDANPMYQPPVRCSSLRAAAYCITYDLVEVLRYLVVQETAVFANTATSGCAVGWGEERDDLIAAGNVSTCRN